MTNMVTQTILAQLGGNRFCAMTGAKGLLALPNGLAFTLGQGARQSINRVRIELKGDDTYAMEFGRVTGTRYQVKDARTKVYADQLRTIFTAATGLETSL